MIDLMDATEFKFLAPAQDVLLSERVLLNKQCFILKMFFFSTFISDERGKVMLPLDYSVA